MTAGDGRREHDGGRPGRGASRGERDEGSRGQANLVAVAVAVVLLTSVLGASVAIAESVLVGATEARDPADAHAAATLADRLVTDTPARYPPGVVPNRSVLTAERVDRLAPVIERRAVRVELGGRTLFERGDLTGGTTVRRAVLVGTPEGGRVAADLTGDDAVTLPDRTAAATINLRPGPNTTVETVRVNGRVVLHDPAGLSGEATVPTSVRRTTELAFETRRAGTAATNATDVTTPTGPVTAGVGGRVVVTYVTLETEPATLVVTVGG